MCLVGMAVSVLSEIDIFVDLGTHEIKKMISNRYIDRGNLIG
ncbi:hypothetical protein ADIS_2012 [Lunatimonas lonarensis]|uniref:Uncharacterized protein n=1 Tax=Lunatimonas lonarensis TaxID=1232681 RepID=R7ZTS4_9BACT|nr:hypothetical protein ADIS_2012 [Lunatimonas lonarensis]